MRRRLNSRFILGWSSLVRCYHTGDRMALPVHMFRPSYHVNDLVATDPTGNESLSNTDIFYTSPSSQSWGYRREWLKLLSMVRLWPCAQPRSMIHSGEHRLCKTFAWWCIGEPVGNAARLSERHGDFRFLLFDMGCDWIWVHLIALETMDWCVWRMFSIFRYIWGWIPVWTCW